MALFRKKPVEVEAFQFSGWTSSRSYAPEWFWDAGLSGPGTGIVHRGIEPRSDIAVLIPTLEGTMRAELGDWIIRGVKGELYPCKPDIFEATYEPASPSSTGGD